MLIFADTFADPKGRGKVVGSEAGPGTTRKGVDVERVLSIDGDGMRIQPLRRPGWRRACLSYGPFERHPGLVLAVFILNGHNTSQADMLPETFWRRFERWIIGSGSRRVRDRLWRCFSNKRIPRVLGQFRRWIGMAKGSRAIESLNENLSVGWFPEEVGSPMESCSAFAMHATGPENGELWVRVGGEWTPVVRGVQNVDLYYVVALRSGGAVYYAASVDGAHGFTAFPSLRPMGVDTCDHGGHVWASIHQSVLGQIGFRADTRVKGVAVSTLPDWESWHGGAQCADRLEGDGPLTDTFDALGSRWVLSDGSLHRTSAGAIAVHDHGTALLKPPAPSGLIRCVFSRESGADGTASLLWRVGDDGSRWELRLGLSFVELAKVVEGRRETASREDVQVPALSDVQVIDDGRAVCVSLNGRSLFAGSVDAEFGASHCGVGFELRNAGSGRLCASSFEAHPRSVTLPDELRVGEPWSREGARVVVSDRFEGPPGPLEGARTAVGGKVWRKLLGAGHFERTGQGAAAVRASRQEPCPGRTLYAIDWDHDGFADLEATITPPGTGRGEQEAGLGGLLVWEDQDNYFVVNSWLCDAYPGASLSCFFTIGGWEDVYDAIWSNVGLRIRHGRPYRLRLICDGLRFVVRVDGEPVVSRALTDVYPDCRPLRIRAVGLIANWEWGLDTGTVFREFYARV